MFSGRNIKTSWLKLNYKKNKMLLYIKWIWAIAGSRKWNALDKETYTQQNVTNSRNISTFKN